jgi:hypothetical protein
LFLFPIQISIIQMLKTYVFNWYLDFGKYATIICSMYLDDWYLNFARPMLLCIWMIGIWILQVYF